MRAPWLLCGAVLLGMGWMQAAAAMPPPTVCVSQPQGPACAEQTRQQLNTLNALMTHLYRLELQKVMGTYTERRLDHAQNLWRRWANAECLFRDGPPDHGVADWNQRQDDCLSGMIRARIAQLDGFLHCAGATCPPR